MSKSKKKLKINQLTPNPFFENKNMVEFYDDSRDDQADDAEVFVKLSQSDLNKNIQEAYKSFFYRYQDYNQINR
jgi:hypothetical protein